MPRVRDGVNITWFYSLQQGHNKQMEHGKNMQNWEQDMAHEATLNEVGPFGIGEGAIETILNEEENQRFNEIITQCIVPASIHDPFTCGDERCGQGTIASSELTDPRVKIFGGLAGIYAAMLLVNQELGKDFVAELAQLRSVLADHGYLIGGHTDTTHADDIAAYVAAVNNGEASEVVAKSACGASDNLPVGIKNIATYGPRPAFARLEKFLLGDGYDTAISGQIIGAASELTGKIPGKLDAWKGGYLIHALADSPDHIEVLTDDGAGVHGHRGAAIVINRVPNTTVDRRKLAELVAADPLLADKNPNAFVVDAWVLEPIAQVLAEYQATDPEQVPKLKQLIIGAIGHTQLGTGITLTTGTQLVKELAASDLTDDSQESVYV